MNKNMQRMIIGPWAHQTTAGRKSGDRVYPKNVTDITKIDLSAFDINNVPISDVVKSDFVTWFRYNLNYDPNNFVGEPKFIIKESHEWQYLGKDSAGTLDSVFVRLPAKDYIIPFVDMINFLSGNGGLKNLQLEVRSNQLGTIPTTQSVPSVGAVLPQFGGGALTGIPYVDFLNDVKPWRFMLPALIQLPMQFQVIRRITKSAIIG